MAETPKNTLKQWFVTGAKPLQAQYWAWLDSYWHKSEAISINAIEGLGKILEDKADADQLQYYAFLDASNIGVNQGAWRTALGINDITPPDVDLTNYYTKGEVDGLLENVTVDLTGYATEGWVTTQTTPATQAEVEASTGTESNPTSSEPATENRKFLSLFNFFKLIKKLRYIHLLPNSATAVANRLRSDGIRLFYANNSAIESTVAYTSDLPTTFVYTPTGNFTTSQLKTAAENAGLIFNGLHFIIKIGANNYTCTIDNGSSNTECVITFGKRGTTGSISFASSRTLNAGADNITVMNGNVNSLAMLNFDTSVDFLTIYNNQ